MEVLALVVGLVAAAVVMPALLLLCGTKRKDAPVGASMANRRGAPGGMLQIDPILQPNWAAKQAERDAQEKKQLAVIMTSKNARLHKAGTGGGEDHVHHVVMRQPSTMADKFALPSHLTKQLGQPSRRAVVPGVIAAARGSVQDGSVDGIPPLPDRKPQSTPMYSGSHSSSIPRGAVNDGSVSLCASVGGDSPDLLHSRGLNSTNSDSRRGLGSAGAGMPRSSLQGPDSAAGILVPVSDMYPVDGSVNLRDVQASADPRVTSGPFARNGSGSGTTGIAWPSLNNENSGRGGSAINGDGRRAQGTPPSLSAGGVTTVAASALDGPRLSHPRVAALSPMLGSTSWRNRSGDGSRPSSQLVPAFELRTQAQDEDDPGVAQGPQEPKSQSQQRPSSDAVERLVQGVDWSAAAVGTESGCRASYAVGTGAREGSPAVTAGGHPQSSFGLTSDGDAAPAAAGSAAAAGRTISSRELHGRPAHLPSPLGGRSSLVDRDREPRGVPSASVSSSVSGISKRWTANGGLTPPPPAVTTPVMDVEAPLPGSSDNISRLMAARGTHPHGLASRSHHSLTAMMSTGGGSIRGESQTWGGDSLDERPRQRALEKAFRSDGRPTTAAAAAAASAAASAAAAAAARGTPLNFCGGGSAGSAGSAGGTPPGSAGGTRANVTWSGMAMTPMVDIEAGPMASTLAGDGAPSAVLPTSRAARAQALLARNKSNLSRLAATTATRSSMMDVGP